MHPHSEPLLHVTLTAASLGERYGGLSRTVTVASRTMISALRNRGCSNAWGFAIMGEHARYSGEYARDVAVFGGVRSHRYSGQDTSYERAYFADLGHVAPVGGKVR